jgi:hypothetical protein
MEKKKNVEKGGSFLSSFCFALSLLALASTLPFLPFCFKQFLLASFFSQRKEKKIEQRKKNHREGKNVEKGGSFPSSSHCVLSFLVLAFGLTSLILGKFGRK